MVDRLWTLFAVTSYCSCKAVSADDEPDPLDYCDGDDDPATDPYDDPIDLEFFEAGSGCGSVQSKQVTQLGFVLDVRSSKYFHFVASVPFSFRGLHRWLRV